MAGTRTQIPLDYSLRGMDRARVPTTRRRSHPLSLALAVGAAAVVPSFIVWPAWQVYALYAAAGAGALQALRLEGTAWLPRLGAPLGAALAAWLVSLAAATALSVNPLLSALGGDSRHDGLLAWLAYATLAALAASALQPPGRLKATLAAIFAAAGAMSVIALLQHWGVPLPRAWGGTGSPPALAAYLVLLFPLVLSLYAADEEHTRRLAFGALALVMYAALVATSVRAAWAALAVGAAAWALVVGLASVRGAAGRLLALAALCAAVTPAVLPAGDTGDAAGWTSLWRTTAPLVLQRPWFGWGPDTRTPAVAPAVSPMPRDIAERPHNDLLEQAVATGLIGLAAYVWLLNVVLRTAWRTARARTHGDHGLRRGDDTKSPIVDPRIVAAGLLGGFVAYLGQLQVSPSYAGVVALFWVLVGAVAALRPRVAHV